MATFPNMHGTSPGVTSATTDTSNEAKHTLTAFRKAIAKNKAGILYKNNIHWGMKSIYYVHSQLPGIKDIDGV